MTQNKIFTKKTIIVFLLSILTFLNSNLMGQKGNVQFGINANPISLLGGDFEGVIAINFLKRFRIKTSLGYSYSNTNAFFSIRSSCLVDDGVDDRLEKGWFSKTTIDYVFWREKNFDTYSGIGFFYTKFKTFGTRDLSNQRLENGGEIRAGGIVLGSTFKKFKALDIDFGIQAFYHNGSQHQVGAECRGRVPGSGPPGSFLFATYAYLLF